MSIWAKLPANPEDPRPVIQGLPPLGDPTTMTASEVMWYIGYAGTKGALVWCTRRRVNPLYRMPGRHGEYVYDRDEIIAAKKNAPGQGYRTDKFGDKDAKRNTTGVQR